MVRGDVHSWHPSLASKSLAHTLALRKLFWQLACALTWIHFARSINHMEIYVRILSIGKKKTMGQQQKKLHIEREKLIERSRSALCKLLIKYVYIQWRTVGQPPQFLAINLFLHYIFFAATLCSSSRTFSTRVSSQVSPTLMAL